MKSNSDKMAADFSYLRILGHLHFSKMLNYLLRLTLSKVKQKSGLGITFTCVLKTIT